MTLYIHELPGGKFREATTDEIAVAEVLRERRAELTRQIVEAQRELYAKGAECKHAVCYDEPGLEYDSRYCVACGKASSV